MTEDEWTDAFGVIPWSTGDAPCVMHQRDVAAFEAEIKKSFEAMARSVRGKMRCLDARTGIDLGALLVAYGAYGYSPVEVPPANDVEAVERHIAKLLSDRAAAADVTLEGAPRDTRWDELWDDFEAVGLCRSAATRKAGTPKVTR